jgi:hypothetical protein
VIILDEEGNRVFSKYYSNVLGTFPDQRVFEKKLNDKTSKQNAEITSLDGFTILYRSMADVTFYILGVSEENEMILAAILDTLCDTLSLTLKSVDKRTILESYENVCLAVDEILDGGILLQVDANEVAPRVTMTKHLDELPITEQTFSQAFHAARETVTKALRSPTFS